MLGKHLLLLPDWGSCTPKVASDKISPPVLCLSENSQTQSFGFVFVFVWKPKMHKVLQKEQL